ncbi:MAG: RNA polymerase sigma factor [Planctomycetota bacterium]|nr:RNA polymerase sigma factor [Planctomycetota bacterium]
MDLGRTQTLIVRALTSREESDFGDMLEYLRPRLVLWATSRLSPGLRARLEPDDVAQETLLAVHKSLEGFQGDNHRAFLAWVFKIAENRIRDLADHHGAQKRQKIQPLSFSQTSPSTTISRSEQVERVSAGLDALSPEYAEVIRLRRFEELSVAEIAELKDKTPNAIRILYCRALKALKEALEANGATP